MTSLKKHLNGLRVSIDRVLDAYLPPQDRPSRIIHRAMRYSVFSGGKRLRPIVAIESCRACGGSISKVMPVACAIELIHTYSLVHDDLPSMDDDDIRRGKPTTHKKFGEAYAILAGDALLTQAFHILSTKTLSRHSLEIIREITEAIGSNGMINGQAVDIALSEKKITARQREYINARKTAALIAVSAKTGGIIADASQKNIRALSRFGFLLGLLFQYTDDILDNESHIKTAGIDAARKKLKEYSERSIAHLRPLGKRAFRLREIVEYIVTRDR